MKEHPQISITPYYHRLIRSSLLTTTALATQHCRAKKNVPDFATKVGTSASRETTMSGRARATRSSPCHGRSSPAVDGGSAPRSRGESPPPLADVLARGTSPASTIGVASATPVPARASPRRSVARQSTEVPVASPSQYGPSIDDGGQSPARLGGGSLHSP